MAYPKNTCSNWHTHKKVDKTSTPKNSEIQNFEPNKIVRAPVVGKSQSTHPPGWKADFEVLIHEFKIWKVTFFKNVLPLRNYGMNFRFSINNGNTDCRCISGDLKILCSRVHA